MIFMILTNGRFGWTFENWQMDNWNLLFSAFGAISTFLTITAGTCWVVYQVKAAKRQMLYSRKEEVIVLLKMIISDYEDSIHRSYMFVPNMEPNIFLNKTIWYSTVNLFHTKRMGEISNLLIEKSKEGSDYESLNRQIDTKVNAEILYIEKMRQNIYISFKSKKNAKLMSNFLDNYIKVISTYLFLFNFHGANHEENFSSIFNDIEALPSLAVIYSAKKLEHEINELDYVFQNRDRIMYKLNRELKRM